MLEKIKFSRPFTETLELTRDSVKQINPDGCIDTSTFICCMIFVKFTDDERMCNNAGISYTDLLNICSDLMDKDSIKKLSKEKCEHIEVKRFTDDKDFYITQDLKNLFDEAYESSKSNGKKSLNMLSMQKVTVYLAKTKNSEYKKLLKEYHKKMREYVRNTAKLDSFVRNVTRLAAAY